MKSIAILFCFGVFASAIEQTKHKLTEQNLQRVKKAGDACAVEHNVDPEMFAKVPAGTVPRDETNDKYMFCLFRKIDLVDVNGHAVVDKVAGYLGDHPLVEKFKEALGKCNEVSKGNPIDTLLGIYRCYFETTPVLFTF